MKTCKFMNICKFMLSGVLLSDLSKSVRYIALHWPVAMGARTEISVKFNRIYFLSNRPLSLKIILQFHCRFWSVEINIWVKNLKILFAGTLFQTWKKFLSNFSLRPRNRSWLYFCLVTTTTTITRRILTYISWKDQY